jgi:hypothetical protein
MIVCPACGGRNVADIAACTFCQHPFGPRRNGRVWQRRRMLLLLGLVLIGIVVLTLASRTPLQVTAV